MNIDTETVGAIIGGGVLLIAVVAWVVRYLKATPEAREQLRNQAIDVAIQAAVTRAEALLKGESGERRKAWVVAQIQGQFPFIDAAMLDAAIEKAVELLNKQQLIATAGHRGFVPAPAWEVTRDTSYENGDRGGAIGRDAQQSYNWPLSENVSGKVWVVTIRTRVPWHSYMTKIAIIGVFTSKDAATAEMKRRESADESESVFDVEEWELNKPEDAHAQS